MSKLICYSLFKAKAEPHERASYVRGFYWNVRMNNLVYPEWINHIEMDEETFMEYEALWIWLKANNNLSLHVNAHTDKLCEGMLWRMKAAFTQDVTHILSRDADSITTYKEAKCVQQWIESGFGFHGINDNPAHGGLMGGMVGFDTAKLKAATGCNTWEELMAKGAGIDFSQRGSDQNFMNAYLHPLIHQDLCFHNLSGAGIQARQMHLGVWDKPIPLVNHKYWESDLTCRHIGSAGVVEMELLRFFERFDEYNWKYKVIEKEFKNLFYWHG